MHVSELLLKPLACNARLVPQIDELLLELLARYARRLPCGGELLLEPLARRAVTCACRCASPSSRRRSSRDSATSSASRAKSAACAVAASARPLACSSRACKLSRWRRSLPRLLRSARRRRRRLRMRLRLARRGRRRLPTRAAASAVALSRAASASRRRSLAHTDWLVATSRSIRWWLASAIASCLGTPLLLVFGPSPGRLRCGVRVPGRRPLLGRHVRARARRVHGRGSPAHGAPVACPPTSAGRRSWQTAPFTTSTKAHAGPTRRGQSGEQGAQSVRRAAPARLVRARQRGRAPANMRLSARLPPARPCARHADGSRRIPAPRCPQRACHACSTYNPCSENEAVARGSPDWPPFVAEQAR